MLARMTRRRNRWKAPGLRFNSLLRLITLLLGFARIAGLWRGHALTEEHGTHWRLIGNCGAAFAIALARGAAGRCEDRFGVARRSGNRASARAHLPGCRFDEQRRTDLHNDPLRLAPTRSRKLR